MEQCRVLFRSAFFFGRILIQPLGYLGHAIAVIAVILWEINYCKLAFKSDSTIAKIAWIIQIVAGVIMLCPGYSNTDVVGVWIVAEMILIGAIYMFFDGKGLRATFCTLISDAVCENFKNSVK